MKQNKIQTRSQKNSQSCVPLRKSSIHPLLGVTYLFGNRRSKKCENKKIFCLFCLIHVRLQKENDYHLLFGLHEINYKQIILAFMFVYILQQQLGCSYVSFHILLGSKKFLEVIMSNVLVVQWQTYLKFKVVL